MKLVQKSLWYLESHLRENISLNDVAKACGVSAPHLTRAFRISTNLSVMQYLKARRLSEAAKALMNGATDILTIAIMSGYESHEAFSRAFKSHFKITPSELRDEKPPHPLTLTEPLKIDLLDTELQLSPKLIYQDEIKLVGLKRIYSNETRGAIPNQWSELLQMIEPISIPLFGIRCDLQDDGQFEYTCALNADDMRMDDTVITPLIIQASTVAIFSHPDHISNIRSSWFRILNEWSPPHDFQISAQPSFEFYSHDFDPVNQSGTVKICIPLEAK